MSSAGVYQIGLIADTHGRLLPCIGEIFAEVDEIWHLGDVCDEEVLDTLRGIQPRLTVVLGNNDFELSYPMTLSLKRGGESFFLLHIPPRLHHLPTEVGWLLHGHTHVPRDEQVGALRIFNPGSAGLANKGAPLSVGILRQESGKPFTAQVIPLEAWLGA